MGYLIRDYINPSISHAIAVQICLSTMCNQLKFKRLSPSIFSFSTWLCQVHIEMASSFYSQSSILAVLSLHYQLRQSLRLTIFRRVRARAKRCRPAGKSVYRGFKTGDDGGNGSGGEGEKCLCYMCLCFSA